MATQKGVVRAIEHEPRNPEPSEGFVLWVARLVHAHRKRLLGYARRRGLDAEAALDAVQDSFVSFLRLPEARSMAQDGDDALKLLTVLLRHNVQNTQRTHRRRDQKLLSIAALDQRIEDSETLIVRAEELARVHGCIQRMERLQRQVVLLSLLDERPREQVGATLGVSPEYLRVLLHRAREHVRNCTFGEDHDVRAVAAAPPADQTLSLEFRSVEPNSASVTVPPADRLPYK